MSYFITSISHGVFDMEAQLRLALKVQLLTPTTHAEWAAFEVILMPLKYYCAMTCDNAESVLQKCKSYSELGRQQSWKNGSLAFWSLTSLFSHVFNYFSPSCLLSSFSLFIRGDHMKRKKKIEARRHWWLTNEKLTFAPIILNIFFKKDMPPKYPQ